MASNNFRAAAYLRKLAKSGAASVNVCFGICWHLRHWMWANGVNSLVLNGHRYYDGYSVVEHGAQETGRIIVAASHTPCPVDTTGAP